jgi:hypothetical protein
LGYVRYGGAANRFGGASACEFRGPANACFLERVHTLRPQSKAWSTFGCPPLEQAAFMNKPPMALSDKALRDIADQGFFGRPGCLADARSACSELIFARAVIEAQTAKIDELNSRTDRPAN